MTGTTNASEKSADATLWVAKDYKGVNRVWSRWGWGWGDGIQGTGWSAIGYVLDGCVLTPLLSIEQPHVPMFSTVLHTSVRRVTRDEYEALLAMTRAEAAVRGDT